MRPLSMLFEPGLLRLRVAETSRHTLQQTHRRYFQTFQFSSRQPWQSPIRPRRHARIRQPPRTRQRRYESTKSGEDAAAQPALSVSQRMKNMSREYGWTALGVYLGLSALDFPFCYLAVRMLGTDRIGRWEHVVVRAFWDIVSKPFPGGEEQVRAAFRKVGDVFRGGKEAVGLGKKEETPKSVGSAVGGASTGSVTDGAVANPQDWTWGVEEAQEEASKEGATLATQLALAYAIHKSFIFVRVPLTAAVLPRVVKTLRSWGWKIGKKPATPVKT